jgi:uncharacterized hydantoinase/oxoprolinase family protein
MATTTKPAPTKSAATAKVATTAKETTKVAVTSNPRLVAMIKSYDGAVKQAKSYLIDLATIVQEEALTRNEVVASIMEGRGVEKSTAESQYSRIKALCSDPEALEKVKNSEMTLGQVRDSSKKTQANPSKEVKEKNANKRMSGGINQIIAAAKELGMDISTIVSSLKDAAKKAGLK